MKILTLGFNGEEPYLKYIEGEPFSTSNYIREECEGNYMVEFRYKGFNFDEELIVNALTDFFSKLDTPISVDALTKMFEEHTEKLKTEEESEIKRISKAYLLNVLTN